jgi:hypothetical protein
MLRFTGKVLLYAVALPFVAMTATWLCMWLVVGTTYALAVLGFQSGRRAVEVYSGS